MATDIHITCENDRVAEALKKAALLCVDMSFEDYVLHAAAMFSHLAFGFKIKDDIEAMRKNPETDLERQCVGKLVDSVRAAKKHTASGQPATRLLFTAAAPYAPLIADTRVSGFVRCLHCGQQVAKKGLTQHLFKHVLAGEVELQLHTRDDGGRYVVFMNADGKQY